MGEGEQCTASEPFALRRFTRCFTERRFPSSVSLDVCISACKDC